MATFYWKSNVYYDGGIELRYKAASVPCLSSNPRDRWQALVDWQQLRRSLYGRGLSSFPAATAKI